MLQECLDQPMVSFKNSTSHLVYEIQNPNPPVSLHSMNIPPIDTMF